MNRFLPWQQDAWRRLHQAHRQGRLPHALLLSGPEQIGKRQFAMAFAESLLCQQPGTDELACGQCPACHLVSAGTHADLGFLEPEEVGKDLKIDAVRAFIQGATLSSTRGGYKIQIIDPADAMNRSSANALLKTLEEPTNNSLMLLISARPGQLPATIRSRCQRLNFPLPDRQIALAWLASQADADWPTLLAVTAGSPLRALALSAQGAAEQRMERAQQWLTLIEGRNDPIALADSCKAGETELQLGWLGGLLLDLLRLRVQPNYVDLFNPDLRERLVVLAAARSEQQWQQAVQYWIDARRSITQQLNLQLQWEQLLIHLADMPGPSRGAR